jgi:hypothetical protein
MQRGASVRWRASRFRRGPGLPTTTGLAGSVQQRAVERDVGRPVGRTRPGSAGRVGQGRASQAGPASQAALGEASRSRESDRAARGGQGRTRRAGPCESGRSGKSGRAGRSKPVARVRQGRARRAGPCEAGRAVRGGQGRATQAGPREWPCEWGRPVESGRAVRQAVRRDARRRGVGLSTAHETAPGPEKTRHPGHLGWHSGDGGVQKGGASVAGGVGDGAMGPRAGGTVV